MRLTYLRFMQGTMRMKIRSYTELCKLKSFEERFEYLRLEGIVGDATFGWDRYLNQVFYKTREWRELRDKVIWRDQCCDMGVIGYEISKRPIVHHMNPLTKEDILGKSEFLLNPEYLITVSHNTHNAITYGNPDLLRKPVLERTANDTCPWKR